MTALENALKILYLKLEVNKARQQMVICSIEYSKWLNCYNKCLKMANSDNPEVVAISQELMKSLEDVSVHCINPNDKEKIDEYRNTISKNLKKTNKIISSDR